MKTTKIDINFQETYQIYIGYNLLIKNHLIDIYRKYAKRVAIIADKNVSELYGKPLFNLFKKKQIKVNLLSFVSSEKNKSRMSKEILENKMLRLGCGRDTMLIAVGGGITTDIAGFIAATYCRGIPVVYIPTSLLAMVDASIGGKTGVNTLFGKNLIGVFYQPKSVIIDIDTLKTLPIDEFKSGIVEIIKHALIKDVKLFDFLELNAKKINGLDRNILMQAISKSCKIKKEIIEQDEKDYGIRQLLNFGHTIGHALEKVTNYKVSHGKAVALGIVVESFISMRLGYLSKNSFERIIHIFYHLGISIHLSKRYSNANIKKVLLLDKKSVASLPQYVLLDAIGKPHISFGSCIMPIPNKILDEGLNFLFNNYTC